MNTIGKSYPVSCKSSTAHNRETVSGAEVGDIGLEKYVCVGQKTLDTRM